MKFAMAMVALEQGKKVRIKEWCEGRYIILDKNKRIIDHFGHDLHLGNTCASYEWELYSESVKLNTLKEGDYFIYNNRSYVILPSYLKKHCGNMTADSIPVMSDTKVFTSLFGNVVVRKV